MDTTLFNPQSIQNFQHDVEIEEQRGDYHQALAICVNTMKSVRLIMEDVTSEVTPYQRLELQLFYDQALARSRFLIGFISIELQVNAPHETSTVLVSRPGSVYGQTTRRATNGFSLDSEYPSRAIVASRCNSNATLNTILPRRRDETANIYEPLKDDMRTIRRRLLQSFEIEIPDISLQSVIGMSEAKNAIIQAVRIPIEFPDSPQAKDPWGGILLFGPSGVGKTHLIKAVASKCMVTFINVRIDIILSKYMGESEKTLQCLFDIAREKSPTIMFIDEVDCLCRARKEEDSEATARLKTQLLTKMDGLTSDGGQLVIIGNTNLPHHLDDAFQRRFEKKVYVGLPSESERLLLLRLFLSNYKHDLREDDISRIHRRTHGFSGSDIRSLVKGAARIQFNGAWIGDVDDQLELKMRHLQLADFLSALRSTRQCNTPEKIRKLEQWNEVNGDGSAQTGIEELIRAREEAKRHSIGLKIVSNVLRFFSSS